MGFIFTDSTIQLDQGRFAYLDVALISSAGAGVGSQTTSHITVSYKKNGDLSITSKTLNGVTSTLSLAVASGAKTITLADSSSFPPTGKLKVSSETVAYTSNNVSTNTITLSSGLGSAYSSGTTVTRIDLFELGTITGYYSILFTPDELSALGPFVYFVSDASGTDFETFIRTVDVVPATGVDTEAAPTLSTCVLKDHLLGLDGSPVQNKPVSARLLALPSIVGSAGIVDTVIATKTDKNGFFQLTAPQGATLDVTIPSIGYRRTIVVPSSTTANLFEIA